MKATLFCLVAALAVAIAVGIRGFAWKADPHLPVPDAEVNGPTEQPAPRSTAKEANRSEAAPAGVARDRAASGFLPGIAKGPLELLLAPGTSMAQAGEVLFRHQWARADPLTPGGDGLGPVYNATSCIACHFQGGVGGGGGLAENVTMFTVRPVPDLLQKDRKTTKLKQAQDTRPFDERSKDVREGVLHAHSTTAERETLQHVHPSLPAVAQLPLRMVLRGGKISLPPGIHLSQRNTTALFGAGLIDEISEEEIAANQQRQARRWGVKTAVAKQSSVVVMSILGTGDETEKPVGRVSRLAGGKVGRFGWKGQTASLASFVRAACANELGLGNAGQAQARPLFQPGYKSPGLDLTEKQCDQLTAFIVSLPRPEERVPTEQQALEATSSGKQLFHKIGCADCHTPNIGKVTRLYSDLLLHRMGPDLEGGGSYSDPPAPVAGLPAGEGPLPGEWRTPPLWDVADSAPYLHDGRAGTLEEAILAHGGQGAAAARSFAELNRVQQTQLVAFLKTLRAPIQR